MTRKDYIALAEALAVARQEAAGRGITPQQAVELAGMRVSDVLAADNPRFDREKFLTACWGDVK